MPRVARLAEAWRCLSVSGAGLRVGDVAAPRLGSGFGGSERGEKAVTVRETLAGRRQEVGHALRDRAAVETRGSDFNRESDERGKGARASALVLPAGLRVSE